MADSDKGGFLDSVGEFAEIASTVMDQAVTPSGQISVSKALTYGLDIGGARTNLVKAREKAVLLKDAQLRGEQLGNIALAGQIHDKTIARELVAEERTRAEVRRLADITRAKKFEGTPRGRVAEARAGMSNEALTKFHDQKVLLRQERKFKGKVATDAAIQQHRKDWLSATIRKGNKPSRMAKATGADQATVNKINKDIIDSFTPGKKNKKTRNQFRQSVEIEKIAAAFQEQGYSVEDSALAANARVEGPESFFQFGDPGKTTDSQYARDIYNAVVRGKGLVENGLLPTLTTPQMVELAMKLLTDRGVSAKRLKTISLMLKNISKNNP